MGLVAKNIAYHARAGTARAYFDEVAHPIGIGLFNGPAKIKPV